MNDVRFQPKAKLDTSKKDEKNNVSRERKASPRKRINPKLLISKIEKKFGWKQNEESVVKGDDPSRGIMIRTEVNLQPNQQKPNTKARKDILIKPGSPNTNLGLITPIPGEKTRGPLGSGNEEQGRQDRDSRGKEGIDLAGIPRSISPINLESRRLSRNKLQKPAVSDKKVLKSKRVPSEVIDYPPEYLE